MEFLYCFVCALVLVDVVNGKEDIVTSVNSKTTKHVNLPKESDRGPLGQGFMLHKMDLLSKELQATGATIFEDLPYDKCVLHNKLGTTQEDSTFFTSTESLYQSVGTETKVDASLKGTYTLGASVTAVTNNIVSGNSEVSGLSLIVKARSGIDGLKQDCINEQPLSKNFIRDFEKLPSQIKKTFLKASWDTYEVFLNKYGSHIAKEIILGSSINQYVFAKSSEKYSQNDFTAKACLSLAGNSSKVGEIGLSACSSVSKEDISTSTSQEMVQKLVVRGGTAKTRAALTGNLSRGEIEKFLLEGQKHPSPILYTFHPIWKVLQTRYVGTKSFAKAVNLEQYYKGYLQFGCPYKETKRSGFAMQEFLLNKNSNPEAPTYGCYIGAEGCHSSDDCHYQAGVWCSCNGDSCIKYRQETSNDGTSKKVAYVNYDKWAWAGCTNSLTLFSCHCENKNQPEQVWTGESLEDPIAEVNAMMTRKHHKNRHSMYVAKNGVAAELEDDR